MQTLGAADETHARQAVTPLIQRLMRRLPHQRMLGETEVVVRAHVEHILTSVGTNMGIAIACRENGCALLGGETAEMPALYADGDYDMAGTIVGVVDKAKILNGSRVAVGDVLIGLPSNGLHTNGYSLARAALFPRYKVGEHLDELGCTVGEALLQVHRSYLHIITPLLDADLLNGLSHITGGGLVGNTSRILADGLALQVNWGSWSMPPIFSVIQQAGNISDDEMRHVFNLGVGMVMVVSPDRVDDVMRACEHEKPFVVGSVVAAN